MNDKFKEISDVLTLLINFIKNFHESKDDYIKPNIRANQVELNRLGKVVGNKVLKHITELNEHIDKYLENPTDDNYSILIDAGIKLKNDLWEL